MLRRLSCIIILAAVVFGSFFICGCANNAQTGALVGGIGGVAIGAIAGGGGGAVVGGAIGAGGGYIVGNEMDK